MAPAQQYHDHVMRLKLIPEFDGYIPYVGETADGELKEPTEAQLIASFHANAKNGKIGGRDLETYVKGVNGIRVLCKIMKYLIQIGITPQLIFSKVADNTDEDDERQAEARRESSDFVRKIISGAFAVRSYDYFRVTPPRRDDHVHIDPVETSMCSDGKMQNIYHPRDAQQDRPGATSATTQSMARKAQSRTTERSTDGYMSQIS